MSKIFDSKIVGVKELERLEDGMSVAEFEFDDGETVEAVVSFLHDKEKKYGDERSTRN
jgi:hypothetical protein